MGRKIAGRHGRKSWRVSSLIPYPSYPSSLILHPSSLIPHPSSFIPHPSSLILKKRPARDRSRAGSQRFIVSAGGSRFKPTRRCWLPSWPGPERPARGRLRSSGQRPGQPERGQRHRNRSLQHRKSSALQVLHLIVKISLTRSAKGCLQHLFSQPASQPQAFSQAAGAQAGAQPQRLMMWQTGFSQPQAFSQQAGAGVAAGRGRSAASGLRTAGRGRSAASGLRTASRLGSRTSLHGAAGLTGAAVLAFKQILQAGKQILDRRDRLAAGSHSRRPFHMQRASRSKRVPAHSTD